MIRSRQQNRDVRAVLEAIRKEPWPQQYEAIHRLSENLDSTTDLVLLNLLANWHSGVRETALEVLAERNKVLGQIAARATLEDVNGFVRNRAAIILGEIGTGLDVRRLAHALQDRYWVVRASAADSLGSIGGRSAWPILQKAMVKDSHAVVRRDAALALSYSQQEKFALDLEQALLDESEDQARLGLLAGLYALGQWNRLNILLEMLNSDDSTVRHAVLNVLIDVLRPDDCAEAVQAIHAMVARESNPGLRTDAQKVAEHLSISVTIPDG